MKWLSRGLFEGLLRLIAQAKDERYALRAAFYEFHYLPWPTRCAGRWRPARLWRIVYDAVVRRLSQQGNGDPEAGYLKVQPGDWVRSHFLKDSYESKRRRYFTEG